jgi:hypothetical protein
MQQIAHWLKQLGMSEYAQCFAENRIDLSVLRELTDQDLKDLGVVLGDRRSDGELANRRHSLQQGSEALRLLWGQALHALCYGRARSRNFRCHCTHSQG